MRAVEPLEKRFWSKVETIPFHTCWEWGAYRDALGYGKFFVKKVAGRPVMRGAHRIAYELTRGPIPAGLELDHLCRNPSCVRPDHLEAVARRTHIPRGYGISAINALKTHCPRGHEYTPENTYGRRSKPERQCRKCHALHQRNRRARGRVASAA